MGYEQIHIDNVWFMKAHVHVKNHTLARPDVTWILSGKNVKIPKKIQSLLNMLEIIQVSHLRGKFSYQSQRWRYKEKYGSFNNRT